MERILVGVDSSMESRRALEWAADLARRRDVALNVVQVQRSAKDDSEEDVRDALEDLVASCPVPVEARVLEGDAAAALLDAAVDGRADLLVVGMRGSGGFLHLHLGSVAQHLARNTTLPLAMVPEAADRSIDHVVVGVDGSSGSLGAVAFAADLAAALGVGATAVYAFEPLVEWVPANDPASWQRHARQQVQEWTAPFEQAGITVGIEIDRDVHPVAALNRALDAHPSSIAVIGTRGRGGFAGLRLGRVPSQLVHQTGAAVVLVPTKVR